MRYLITGHTGFKGAWLTLLLRQRGHEVAGIALEPVDGALYSSANLAREYVSDERIDIRDQGALREAVAEVAPDVVLHLAAQPLVRESYRNPRETYETNVLGTLNILEAVSNTESVKAHVVVTTDKVYRNDNRAQGYAEADPLGAADPYSTSKAMADLLAQSWATMSASPPVAIVRGGNVIGGGDVSQDRLLPDLMRVLAGGGTPELRYPHSVRPWQHVLDCLSGYLAVGDELLAGRGQGEWNFGPGPEAFVSVAEVAELASRLWGGDGVWRLSDGEHPHEAGLLALDAAKAERELHWVNRLRYPESVEWVVEWHRAVDGGESPRSVTEKQIARFVALEENGRP